MRKVYKRAGKDLSDRFFGSLIGLSVLMEGGLVGERGQRGSVGLRTEGLERRIIANKHGIFRVGRRV